jgi:gluconolactonase
MKYGLASMLLVVLTVGCKPAADPGVDQKATVVESAAVDQGSSTDQDPSRTPSAVIDLMTPVGVAQVGGEWRYHDVTITKTKFLEAGPDGQPSKTPNTAYDIEPKAGWASFDDSGWPSIDPTTLDKRRTAGRVSFNWYRIRLTIPDTIDGFDPTGSTVTFEVSVDDYAEVWVDGELSRIFGQRGGSVINGWNAPNRLIVGRDVKPGQQIQLAIFGINGPISQPPTNYVYVRRAKLEFAKGTTEPLAVEPQEVNVLVKKNLPALDEIVPRNPKLFKLAEGFTFTEGPVWVGDALLFSDPNENRIYRYAQNGVLSVFRENSGYEGEDVARYTQPGSNGNTLDPEGRLTTAEHGNRRISRTEKDGSLTVLASAYQGKRLNSPNDLVSKSDGAIYFTDPPFGLPEFYDDPDKELPFSGIYRAKDGEVDLLARDLKGPNGIAFSPDERFLYVGNWDPERKIVMRYPVKGDGTLGKGKVFFDMREAPEEEALDGLKVDVRGNVYASGPGGVWILSPAGKHLGTIVGPRPIHNFAWGDEDGKTLYMTAHGMLYRMPLLVEGVRP